VSAGRGSGTRRSGTRGFGVVRVPRHFSRRQVVTTGVWAGLAVFAIWLLAAPAALAQTDSTDTTLTSSSAPDPSAGAVSTDPVAAPALDPTRRHGRISQPLERDAEFRLCRHRHPRAFNAAEERQARRPCLTETGNVQTGPPETVASPLFQVACLALASRMACQTRAGVIGISR